jgi:hypothetical protein
MPNRLIRCGLHLEIQKYGKQVDLTCPELKDQLESIAVAEDAAIRGMTRIGIGLTYAENRALFAVQYLLDQTDYRGSAKPVTLSVPNAYLFDGQLPQIEVTVAGYLHAYGLKRRQSKRGKQEFNAEGREAALDALRSLNSKEFLMAYDRKYGTEGNQRIEVISPLIRLSETGGKLSVTPNPILVDQIDKYFLWKPADLYSQVLTGKDRTESFFIEYLLYLFEMNRRNGTRAVYVVKRQTDVIAHAVKMNSLLEARQQSRIRGRLTDLYRRGVELGYLEKYEIDVPGAKVEKLDCLHLSGRKFKAMRSGLPVT